MTEEVVQPDEPRPCVGSWESILARFVMAFQCLPFCAGMVGSLRFGHADTGVSGGESYRNDARTNADTLGVSEDYLFILDDCTPGGRGWLSVCGTIRSLFPTRTGKGVNGMAGDKAGAMEVVEFRGASFSSEYSMKSITGNTGDA